MAHRSQEFRETCAICRQLGSDECARCGRPLCANHAHGDDRRCADCERDFEEHLIKVGPGKEALAVDHRQLVSAFAAWLSVFALVFFAPGGALTTLFLVIGLGLVTLINHKRLRAKSQRLRALVQRRERAKFLTSREPKLLTAHTPAECRVCGAEVSGNYCSTCGTPIRA